MTIHIEELTFECIIGILDFERVTPQEVIVNLKLTYDYVQDEFINYAEVIELIQQRMLNEKYELLETAINEILTMLSTHYPNLNSIELKICKPNIIKNAKVSLSKHHKIERNK